MRPQLSRTARLILLLALAALIAVNAVMAVLSLSAPSAPSERHFGTPSVGGPFALTGLDGLPLTSETLRGRPVILLFGWTLDPGLTEPALRVLEAALQRLQPKPDATAVVFVSLDPERDSAAQVAAFIGRTGSRARGALGDRATIEAMARSFRLHQARIPDPALPGGYSIDQSALYYLLNRDGSFAAALAYTNDSAGLAAENR